MRTFSVLLKDRWRAPVSEADHERAREVLMELAEEASFELYGDVVITHSGFSKADRLHVAAYAARGRRQTVEHWQRGSLATVDTMALHAHRSPLHAREVTGATVERALATRDPYGALAALHLLYMPVVSNRVLDHAGRMVLDVFDPEPEQINDR